MRNHLVAVSFWSLLLLLWLMGLSHTTAAHPDHDRDDDRSLLLENGVNEAAVAWINCGCLMMSCTEYTDALGRVWWPDDAYYYMDDNNNTHSTAITYDTAFLTHTADPVLFQTLRTVSEGSIRYHIPVANTIISNDLRVTLYFVHRDEASSSVFDVILNDETVLSRLDLSQYETHAAQSIFATVNANVAESGVLRLELRGTNPVVAAIAVRVATPHWAHAVPGGPYVVTVEQNAGAAALVTVDASESHTHGPGLELVRYEWKLGGNHQLLSDTNGPMTTFVLPVGSHVVTLIVTDSGGYQDSDIVTVTVLEAGFPVIDTIAPDFGSTAGGDRVAISGSGFGNPQTTTTTTVQFGETVLTDIEVVDAHTIIVLNTPPNSFNVPVRVTVQTPNGVSEAAIFNYYENNVPVQFQSTGNFFLLNTILSLFRDEPSVVEFGPDERLYVGTVDGRIFRVGLTKNKVTGMAYTEVLKGRAILGIAFDPADNTSIFGSFFPTFYVSHCELFHDGLASIHNGKVSTVSGLFMKDVSDKITGLPVSNQDHGVNGIHFGDNGELLIQVGSLTSAGIPGQFLTLDEVALSAATLIAEGITRPGFNGELTYDEEGNLLPGTNVEIFAHGVRNSFDLVKHSNGNWYCTDNGPTGRFGSLSTGCGEGEEAPGITQQDKLLLLERGEYYGHPNRQRGGKDPRQCSWRAASEASEDSYTQPLAVIPSSSDGIIEFQSNHFAGQARGNLIVSKYLGGLYRYVLARDGKGIVKAPIVEMIPDEGLHVRQGPDGTLYTANFKQRAVRAFEPVDSTEGLRIMSVFPRRGNVAGGSILHIYGKGLWAGIFAELLNLFASEVKVGGRVCQVIWRFDNKISCILPGGTAGAVDVEVRIGLWSPSTTTFEAGFRYITG